MGDRRGFPRSTGLTGPSPPPLLRVGPSQASDLLACGYRVAWARDPRELVETKHPKALLGVAGHAVCERAGKGQLELMDEGWTDWYEAAWSTEVGRVAEGAPELGPPERWPAHNLQKALWRNRAWEVAERTAARRPDQENDPSQGVELELEGYDGRLKGKADVVLREGNTVEIRDFKSGRILADTGELSEGYKVQLLLYAALYEQNFGIWPARLIIDPLVRDPVMVEPDRLAAWRAVEETLAGIARFNAALEEGTLESLAQPSRDTCRFCAHTLRCEPFWRAANSTWDGRPPALAGAIVARTPGIIELSVQAGTIDPGLWQLGGVAGEENLDPPARVRIVAFERRRDTKLACGAQTRIQRL